jgi:predicted enzyme related to lactoylglutathione lyase
LRDGIVDPLRCVVAQVRTRMPSSSDSGPDEACRFFDMDWQCTAGQLAGGPLVFRVAAPTELPETGEDLVINTLRHFAINANDINRARRFYEKVFGWKFEAWGPPDFYLIHSGTAREPGIRGALQLRRELVPGKPMIGYECSFSIADADRTAAAVRASGGRIIMEKTILTGVGDLIFFEDPEGNVAGAMRYDSAAE